jgi:hypothetical protein
MGVVAHDFEKDAEIAYILSLHDVTRNVYGNVCGFFFSAWYEFIPLNTRNTRGTNMSIIDL